MAESFTDEQLKEYRDAFLLFDKDEDGVITMKELVTVLRSIGMAPSNAEIDRMVRLVDCNRSGAIDFEEFLHLMVKISEAADTEEDLIQVFRVIDQDGDGYISRADLREVVIRLSLNITHHDMDEMFEEADKDGDGNVNYEEFLKIILAKY